MAGTFSIDRTHPQARARAPASAMSILFVCLLYAAIVILPFAPNPLTVSPDDLLIQRDDAMRLVQTRDFFEGAGWFDLRQERLGAENAAPMHWSRLIDLPLAMIMAAFAPWAGEDRALLAAAVVWPTICVFLYLLVSSVTAARLAGKRGLVLMGLIALPYVLVMIRPGRVDYHYFQTILMLTMAFLLISGDGRALRPALAGGVASLSLAVGLAELPIILASSAVMAGRWVLGGAEARTETLAFSGSLAVGAPLAMLLTVPPEQLLVGWCDALSIVYVTGLTLGAGVTALAALALPATERRGARLAALGVAVAVSAGAVIGVYPECLGGPYVHLDPRTAEWIEHRPEARGFTEILAKPDWMLFHALTFWPLIGIGGIVLAAVTASAERRHAWILLGAIAVTGWVISLTQVRGTNSSLPFAAFGAMFLVAWVTTWQGLARVLKPVLIFALWSTQTFHLPQTVVANAQAGTSVGNESEQSVSSIAALKLCRGEEQMAPVAALPPGRVAASIELGPHVLLYTPHWVLGSPHHRNYAGNLAAIRLDETDRESAYQILREWRIDYFLFCDAISFASWSGIESSGEPGPREDVPSWLEPMGGIEPLRIFRFVPRSVGGPNL